MTAVHALHSSFVARGSLPSRLAAVPVFKDDDAGVKTVKTIATDGTRMKGTNIELTYHVDRQASRQAGRQIDGQTHSQTAKSWQYEHLGGCHGGALPASSCQADAQRHAHTDRQAHTSRQTAGSSPRKGAVPCSQTAATPHDSCQQAHVVA